MTKLDGPSHGPQNKGKASQLVILLHGYGADGNDLIGLAPVLAPLMPDAVFVAPNAPYPCEGNPTGYQWFGISRLDPEIALAGARSAAPYRIGLSRPSSPMSLLAHEGTELPGVPRSVETTPTWRLVPCAPRAAKSFTSPPPI